MDLVTLTSELRKEFGITSAIITLNNDDYIVSLKQMSDDYVVFTIPEVELQYGQILILKFPSKYGKVEVQIVVSCFYTNEFMQVVEAQIIIENHNDFFAEFQKFIRRLLEEKKRKEERILCTKKNLELLNLINIVSFEFKYRNIRGVIKDISYSAIRVLCNPVLLQEKGELFNFKLNFIDPDEVFIFQKCPIIRKELFTFENQNFAQIVFKLEDNLRYKNRLTEYFNKLNHKDIHHKL